MESVEDRTQSISNLSLICKLHFIHSFPHCDSGRPPFKGCHPKDFYLELCVIRHGAFHRASPVSINEVSTSTAGSCVRRIIKMCVVSCQGQVLVRQRVSNLAPVVHGLSWSYPCQFRCYRIQILCNAKRYCNVP